LYYLLRNPIYVGRIAHQGASYPGQHVAILDGELWNQVQAKLTENRQGESRTARSSTSCLLSGLLFDDRGNLMSPSHARKADGRRYRYYVSQAVLQGRADDAGTIRRVSASAIESLVEQNIRTGLPKVKRAEWINLSVGRMREQIEFLVQKITISSDSIELALTEAGRDLIAGDTVQSGLTRIAIAMKPSLGGRQVVPRGGAEAARVDRLERNGETGLHDLARQDECSRPYISSMIKLAYLAPEITRAILDGTQPGHLTLADLMQRDIPIDWTEQRRAFGFL
jgi:hypothetical protein